MHEVVAGLECLDEFFRLSPGPLHEEEGVVLLGPLGVKQPGTGNERQEGRDGFHLEELLRQIVGVEAGGHPRADITGKVMDDLVQVALVAADPSDEVEICVQVTRDAAFYCLVQSEGGRVKKREGKMGIPFSEDLHLLQLGGRRGFRCPG